MIKVILIIIAKRRIVSGPFRGIKYVNKARGSSYWPKLLGSYEKELHEIVSEIAADRFGVIIDIGAAEGYYAVGFAKIGNCQTVVAYESDLEGQLLIKTMAENNGIHDKIVIKGLCRLEDLDRELRNGKRYMIIMDVEGAECHLLDPTQVEGLYTATMLIEIHDFVDLNICQILLDRFKHTHVIRVIWQQQRTLTDFPLAINNSLLRHCRTTLLELMEEYRPCQMRWLYLKPFNNYINDFNHNSIL